jgi:hypothetical protein
LKKFGKYRGRRVRLDSPRYVKPGEAGYGRKKFVVFADMRGGKVQKVLFGQPGMRIKKNNPARRRSYRARAGCSKPKKKNTPGYWSCRKW